MDYLTLRAAGTSEYIDRKSRFIGHAAPVCTEDEAMAFLREIRTRYWDARHHVYAYVLRSGAVRYSDDSEPQGTAGLPTLEVLTRSGLTDAVIVTTRYFGGVLLGTGGLTRAYGRAAHDAVSAAGTVRMQVCRSGTVVCSYAQYGAVGRALTAAGAAMDDTGFGQDVTVRFHAAPARLPALIRALADATAGSAVPEWTGEAFFPTENDA